MATDWDREEESCGIWSEFRAEFLKGNYGKETLKGVQGQAEDLSWQTHGGVSSFEWLWKFFELGNDLIRCDLPSV